MIEHRFAGRGVVVTGAAQGIGLGLTRAFLAEGAGVVAAEASGFLEADLCAQAFGRAKE